MKYVSACFFIVALSLSGPAHATCKLALALGLDISSSVDKEEYWLQLGGVADALESMPVIEAILTPKGAHIAVAVYEWSGYQQQDMIAGWTVLDSPSAIRQLSGRLRAHQRPYWTFETAIGKGVQYGAQLLAKAPPCARHVLDIAGDGVGNNGPNPTDFNVGALMRGITINGLVIRGEEPDPLPYYQRHVKYGPQAFVALADDFNDYRRAMQEKLLREIGAELMLGQK